MIDKHSQYRGLGDWWDQNNDTHHYLSDFVRTSATHQFLRDNKPLFECPMKNRLLHAPPKQYCDKSADNGECQNLRLKNTSLQTPLCYLSASSNQNRLYILAPSKC